MKFGLKDEYITILKMIFQKYPSIEEVVIYGSRAKGSFKERSDLDLIIKNSKIERYTISDVLFDIDESDFPFMVDLQDFELIKNKKLIEHIERVGKPFYKTI
jgi:predicted nucleotidyltransferase